ncbi:hypothetical protein QCA50_007764 [Cerrena zonata]|uniref:Postreplication repair E3 ubiquitin-protein ligase RAD18 n=1 Tax=Cerrena zonata TaxID=2478898 RepID=A0AAW0GG64_9APHY
MEDVPDPTDFPPNDIAPGLRELDEALRCTICGDLFSGPLSVACGHCFCSLCIRTQLNVKAECPLCRKSTTEFHLRKVQSIEDAVQAWKIARPYILQLSRDEVQRRLQFAEARAALQDVSTRSPKKRRRNPSLNDDDEVIEIIKPTSKMNGQRSGLSPADSSGSSTPQSVSCPVCQKQVPMAKINQHLDDGCKSPTPIEFEVGSSTTNNKGKQKQDWQKLFGAAESSTGSKGKGKAKSNSKSKLEPSATPIPKVAYHTLKEKRLREMLSDHDLPTTGDKDTLIRRHERWVLVYNANLDRNPRDRETLEELIRKLKKWEDTRGGKKIGVGDVKAYEKANKVVFAGLIEAARPKKPPPKPQQDDPEHDNIEQQRITEATDDPSEIQVPISSSPGSSVPPVTEDEQTGMPVDG